MGAGAGGGAIEGGGLSEQAESNAAEKVTAARRVKSFRWDFMGWFGLWVG
jgi:hypothetical protein